MTLSFRGYELFIGVADFAGQDRVVHLTVLDQKVVVFAIPVFDGDRREGVGLGASPKAIASAFDLETIAWWDRNYWDQVSFIEDAYPKSR